MLESEKGPSTTDIARAMKRFGFSQEEIYDTLTGAGVSGTEAQLLLDRIDDEFEDAQYESKISRIGEEVEQIFETQLEMLEIRLESKIRNFEKTIASLEGRLKGLEEQINELHKKKSK